MDKRISGLIQFEDEKKRLRHENIIRQFKEFFAQEALEEARKREFEQNGRDFEYLPDFEANSKQQRPDLGPQNIWGSPVHPLSERTTISPSASTNAGSGSPSGSMQSNYLSFASPLSSYSLTSSPKDEVFNPSINHQLFSSSYPDLSGRGSSPLAKPLHVSPPQHQPFEPFRKSVSTQTDSVVIVQNEVLTSSVFKSAARATTQKYKKKMQCVFCMKNQDHERVYTSHNLKDADGKITCPVLRNYVCPKCGATGDSAHTISYCTERL